MKFKYLLVAVLAAATLTACFSQKKGETKEDPAGETTEVAPEEELVQEVCNGNPSRASYIVISKETMTLKLYDTSDKLIACYPVAVGKNYGNKRKEGDMKTPEGTFTVQRIQEASSWTHDFKDGKGVIKHAYGDWFIRLRTPPHTGIGIHGTHAPSSIGTRATEGCIRLHNENLNKLQPLVKVGMKVIIETSQRDIEADGGEVMVSPENGPIKAKPESQDGANSAKTTPVGGSERVVASGDIIEVTIESGQLLGHISVMYNTTVDRILELNPGLDPRKIRVGQVIKVQQNTDQQSSAPKVQEDPNGVYHTIESGDSFGKLAGMYDTTSDKIQELNPGVDPRKLQLGQRIRVK